MKDYRIWVFWQTQVILHVICCCARKILDKNLAVALKFFDISQPFKCLSILSPNITINFSLFELISRLLIDELSSLLSTFSLAHALLEFLCNGVDCFGSMCAIFLFTFFTLSVLLFLSFLEDSVNLESAINSVWRDFVLKSHYVAESIWASQNNNDLIPVWWPSGRIVLLPKTKDRIDKKNYRQINRSYKLLRIWLVNIWENNGKWYLRWRKVRSCSQRIGYCWSVNQAGL